MAPAGVESVQIDVFISRTSIILAPEATPYLTALYREVSTQIQYDYPTTVPTNSSYFQSSSTLPGFVPSSLTTIVISKTATVTLTTIALISSESTIETLAPTEAPFLPSTSTNINLSIGQIAGVVLGAIIGLMLFVLIFYLLLTRAKWVGQLAHWRLEIQEKKYCYPSKRPLRRTERSSANTRRAGEGKQTRLKRMARGPLAPIPTMSGKQPGSNEIARRQRVAKRGRRTGGRR
ncbi:hypothetical protein F5B18DRAFT_610315 [Nemania serpens]|nr:hypothetical protein F5B18DRAFT_610315 [Nemania serpens]